MSIQINGQDTTSNHGTLMWIGDRDSITFRDAYAFCDRHVSQLAYRENLQSAIERVATSVRTMIYCRDNDSAHSAEHFRQARELYTDAKSILLLGPLCAGARPSASDLFQVPSVIWHQWESVLPAYLRRCGWANRPASPPNSIAVVAASYTKASALLAIASSGGASTIWCRPNQVAVLRQFDEVWWDDSATASEDWSQLLGRHFDDATDHVWISGHLTPNSKQRAIESGMELVITKPGDLSLLINRVTGQRIHQDRHAA